jgi:hypothetical protein
MQSYFGLCRLLLTHAILSAVRAAMLSMAALQGYVRAAVILVDASGSMMMNPRYASSQPELISRMQALAGELLTKAEPGVERYTAWPLPDPHPLVRMLNDARLHAAKVAEMAPAAGSAGALNMDQLLDFLPPGGGKAAAGKAAGGAAGAAGSASKGKGKKKAGSKK